MIKFAVTIFFIMIYGQSTAENLTLNEEDLNTLQAKDRDIIISTYPELINKNSLQGAPVVATIGPPGCNFNASVRTTPIQDAIDWPNATYTELRIVEGVYDEENITLNDRDMVIKGGYASCADAANGIQTSPDSLATVIQSSQDTNPVFRIDGNTTRNNVRLQNLTIQNSGAVNWYGGAIRVNSADVALTLDQVALANNNALRGGAIAVTGNGGDPTISLRKVQINNNQAEQGGGIYCRNPNAFIGIYDSAGLNHGIYSNAATDGSGGGILLDNGCEMTTYQGSQNVQIFGSDNRGINFNTATEHGGGIAVLGGAKATLLGRNSCFPFNNSWLCLWGNNVEPISLVLNVADYDDNSSGDGGAVYADGAGSEVIAENVYMVANLGYNGGAIAAENNATVTVKTAFENEAGPISCWQPGACTDLNNNLAEISGGAFYSQTGAVITVRNAQIRNHRANAGVAGYVRDSNSVVDVEGSVLFGNGSGGNGNYNDLYLFRSFQGGESKLTYSTVGENDVVSRFFGNNDGRVYLGNSIIYDPDGVDIYTDSGATNPNQFGDCLIVHEDQTPVGTNMYTLDPQFENVGNDDYRLKDGSPAVDMCGQPWFSPTAPDMDGNLRPIDLPGIGNLHGPDDAGAFEATSSDIIFKDGFE